MSQVDEFEKRLAAANLASRLDRAASHPDLTTAITLTLAADHGHLNMEGACRTCTRRTGLIVNLLKDRGLLP